jgi:hypothetical protein
MSANKTIRAAVNLPGGIYTPYNVAAAVTGNATAELFYILPVSTTGAARTITPPTPSKAGDWFAVVDATNNANTNNITVDFSANIKYGGGTADVVLAADGAAAIFVYSGVAATGYIRIA